VRCFAGKISRTLFLTRDSPASVTDGSGCWLRMLRTSVLGRSVSHLLLIRTNLGHGTLLTAACARQGCSATDYYYYYYYYVTFTFLRVPDFVLSTSFSNTLINECSSLRVTLFHTHIKMQSYLFVETILISVIFDRRRKDDSEPSRSKHSQNAVLNLLVNTIFTGCCCPQIGLLPLSHIFEEFLTYLCIRSILHFGGEIRTHPCFHL
jgi:hypothetical protein